MKKGISKVKKNILIVVMTVCLALIFLLAVDFVEDSTMKVQYGDDTRVYFVPMFQRDTTEYEDSQLFDFMYERTLADITRMCVIKNQMETAGKYNPDKNIDITLFAYRANLANIDNVSAVYTLDNLISWGIKGFTYKDVDKSTLPFYDLDQYTEEALPILYSRYKSIEGKDLIEYASSYEEYEILVKNLIETSTALAENYSEYEKYNDMYGVGKTNIYYCYQMNNDGKLVRYTNYPKISSENTIDDITLDFYSQKKYICYNPNKLSFKTNTNITAEQMKQILQKYEYSFSDNSRIWIGLDDSYAVRDGFASGREYYNNRTGVNSIYTWIVTIGSLVALYIIIFSYLNVVVGRPRKVKREGQTEYIPDAGAFDKIPVEIFVCITILMLGIWFYSGYFVIKFVYNNILVTKMIYLAVALLAIFLNMTFMPIWYAYVRRFKIRNIFSNSIIRAIFIKLKEVYINAYDNGNVLYRTWIPYIIFLLINLVLVLTGIGGIVIAFIFDMIVGTYMYSENSTRQKIIKDINVISEGEINHKVDIEKLHGDNLQFAEAVNNIGDGIRKAVNKSMKDEKMKADLVTNVSHDIKTPLTSIINYVDLLKREQIDNEKVTGYIDVLDQKSQRLKQLIDDLVEASKISSGNIALTYNKINVVELINQSIGEYEDKFGEVGLTVMFNSPENPVFINVDSKSIFRVIENLYNNIYKYAMENTRVYVDITENQENMILSIKNISKSQLKVGPDELLERFKQGDESRKTEGSGLGLGIAKNLVEAMDGSFDLSLDGDLFKVVITFAKCK